MGIFDYLSAVSPDYSDTVMSLHPQDVMEMTGDYIQASVPVANDRNAVTMYDEPEAYVRLSWDYITEADAETLLDFFYDPAKGHGIARTFVWAHPTNDTEYVVQFVDEIEESLYADAHESVSIKLGVWGPVADGILMTVTTTELSEVVKIGEFVNMSEQFLLSVSWGDTATDDYETNDAVPEHTYALPGEYQVVLSGDVDKIQYVVFGDTVARSAIVVDDMAVMINIQAIFLRYGVDFDLVLLSGNTSLQFFESSGAYIHGGLDNMPSTVSYIYAEMPWVTGAIGDLSDNSFVVAGLPAWIGEDGCLSINGSSSIAGDVAPLLENSADAIVLRGLDLTYSTANINPSFAQAAITLYDCGLSDSEIDQFCIDLDGGLNNIPTLSQQYVLAGDSNGIPTAVSAPARANLAAKGASLIFNT